MGTSGQRQVVVSTPKNMLGGTAATQQRGGQQQGGQQRALYDQSKEMLRSAINRAVPSGRSMCKNACMMTSQMRCTSNAVFRVRVNILRTRLERASMSVKEGARPFHRIARPHTSQDMPDMRETKGTWCSGERELDASNRNAKQSTSAQPLLWAQSSSSGLCSCSFQPPSTPSLASQTNPDRPCARV